MSASPVQALQAAGQRVQVLDAAGERGGNLVLCVGDGEQARVLKLYRRRRAWLRGPFRALENRALGKRGSGPRARARTECESLAAWQRHGQRAPHWIDQPLPPGISAPALWMEYTPGPTLHQVIADPTTELEQVLELCRRFGASIERRHRVAEQRGEILLIPEHAGARHVLLHDGELVQIDHETGWRPSYPLRSALAQEYTMAARSLLRAAEPGGRDGRALLKALLAGHQDRGRVAEVVGWEARRKGLGGRLHRWHDRRKRPTVSKQGARLLLLELCNAAPASQA